MLVSIDALVIDSWHEVSLEQLLKLGGVEDKAAPQSSNFMTAVAEEGLTASSITLGGITMNALLVAKWMCNDITTRFVGFAGADCSALLELTGRPSGIELLLHADVSRPTQQVCYLYVDTQYYKE